MTETLPRTLGRYTLLERLGRGGMGQVFMARVEGIHGIQKLCVVKTLRSDLAEGRGYVNRFLDEARLAMQLSHRNICSVFDVGEIEGQYFLAMDMVAGTDLRTLWDAGLDSSRPLEPALALYITIEALEGLDYAHRATDVKGRPLRVVHRDVSPQNVMVSYEGTVQLIDFGLAFSLEKVEQTQGEVVHGKAAYMPPEQVRGEALDKRADVFAAAVMLYELLSGERYYTGIRKSDLLSVAASGTFKPAAWQSIDKEMRAILGAALAPEPADRTSSAGRFAQALRAHAIAKGLRSDAADMRAFMLDLFGDQSSEESAPEPTMMVDEALLRGPSPSKDVTGSVPRPRQGDVDTRGVRDALRPGSEGSASVAGRSRGPDTQKPQSPRGKARAAAAEAREAYANAPTDARIIVPELQAPHEPPKRAEHDAPFVKETTASGPMISAAVDQHQPTLAIPRPNRKSMRSASGEGEALDRREASAPKPTTRASSDVKPMSMTVLPASMAAPGTARGTERGAERRAEGGERPKQQKETAVEVARRTALAGAGLIAVLVVLISVAPWQRSAPKVKKPMLPPRSSATEKLDYLQKWCPELECAVPLLDARKGAAAEVATDGATDGGPGGAGESAPGVDACYRRCANQPP